MRISSGITGKPPVRASVFALLALVACASWGIAGPAVAATLNPAVLPTIQSATFEVVEAKPAKDPLTYEKPLPLDLLPYQERTDKYHSIGTAFALGHNRYVTAGHVLLAGMNGLWGPPALRDASGHVYAIGKIEKFSLRKDFVVFSLASPPPGDAALTVDAKPALNQVVYAVGNALGTGVVIRDGLYTSDTPEQQDGQWKWMRFSAAASPGNSGGPLLDKDGKVIGVVLMKSANENLNYALPISEVLNAPDNVAVIDKRIPYSFDLFDSMLSNVLKAQFALPLDFAQFSASYQKVMDDFADGQLKALLAKESAKLFPNGEGSSELLHGMPSMGDFPTLITRNSSGTWALAGRSGGKVTLPDNGYLTPGMANHTFLFHLRKPDSISSKKLYGDPVMLMDTLLKTGFVKRRVGPERVQVTSLGKPTQDTLYTDRWQRHWQVRVWPMPYVNARVITFALPVPDGYAVMMRILPAGFVHDYMINLQAIADFAFVTYDGTLAQWKDFLGNTALLPGAFEHIHIGIDYGHRFSYASQRLSFDFTPALQKIDPQSLLTLGFTYADDHGKVTWDVGDVWLAASASDHYWVNLARNVMPSPDLDDSYQSEWKKLLQHRHPYDGVVIDGDDTTKIMRVVDVPAGVKPGVLYTAYYDAEGSHPQAEMKTKLDLLMKNLRVMEH
ncbi:Trypsin-like peptidase domain-containing protein [Rhodanobacter glycinis]|uniref:Trypsin-like peptidase domain-containing protein n=1 Tax=Rhodanobacter glycinis TaxID=582702 RepID=A0A1I4ELA0_9GAMM|nr:Trypsin-like peptidase domain-containing protein [Rhodanobacter glycinis]